MIKLLNYLAKHGITMKCNPQDLIIYENEITVYKFLFRFPSGENHYVIVRSDSEIAEYNTLLIEYLMEEIKDAQKLYG